MSIESLKRVMWRLRKRFPDKKKITNYGLHKIIMVECGTSPQTYRNNRAALIMLGWLRTHKAHWVRITNKDLEDE